MAPRGSGVQVVVLVDCATKKKSEVFKHFGFLYCDSELIDDQHFYCSRCVENVVAKYPRLQISREGSDLSAFFRFVYNNYIFHNFCVTLPNTSK